MAGDYDWLAKEQAKEKSTPSFAERERAAENRAAAGKGELSRAEEDAVKPQRNTDKDSNRQADDGENVNFTGKGKAEEDKKKKKKRRMLALKKSGPTVGIAGALIGAILGGSALMGPVGQIQHIIEMLNGRYDMSGYTSMRRTNRILAKKLTLRGQTSGIKAIKTNLTGSKLYFSKMSARTIAKFKNAGFDLLDDTGKIIDSASGIRKGQAALLRRTGTDKTWAPDDFMKDYNSRPEFRADINKVYKGRVANWFDAKIAKFKSKFKLWGNAKGTKAAANADMDGDGKPTTDEGARAQNEEQSARDYGDANKGQSGELTAPDKNNFDLDTPEGQSAYQSALDDFNATSAADDLADDALNSVKNSLDDFGATGAKMVINKIGQFLNVLGWADFICQIFLFFEEIGKVIKTDQIDQMMNMAYLFLADGDRIKSGEQTPENVAAVGTRLNTPSSYDVIDGDKAAKNGGNVNDDIEAQMEQAAKGVNDDIYGKSQPKTATEAQGFKWIQFFELIPQLDGSAAKFVAGAVGFFGMMINLAKNEAISSVCHFVTHPVTRFVTTAIGIALTLIPIGKAVQAGAAAAGQGFKAAVSAGFKSLAKSLFGNGVKAFIKGVVPTLVQFAVPLILHLALPHLAKLVAGEICKAVVGQDYMNCLVSGAGAASGKAASYGGNSVLSKVEAHNSYLDFQKYVAQVAEEERLERSPFDVNSKYTFMGSIVSNLWSYTSGLRSISGVFTTLGSLVRTSAFVSLPSAAAADFDLAKFDASMELCEDDSYKDLATDPWCNLIYGIPVQQLRSADPDAVLDLFVNDYQAEVLEDTGELLVYEHYYVRRKINRTTGREYCSTVYTWKVNYNPDNDPDTIGICDKADNHPAIEKTPLTLFRVNCMERSVYEPIDVNDPRDQRFCIIGNGYVPTDWRKGGVGCLQGKDYTDGGDDSIQYTCSDWRRAQAGRYTDNYRTNMSLFYIDTRIEDNMDGSGLDDFNNGSYSMGSGTSNAGGSGGGSGSAKLDSSTTIFVGDSRFVGMCDSVEGSSSCTGSGSSGDRQVLTSKYIAKVGAGHSWLTATGISEVEKILNANSGKKYSIVFGMGVNDFADSSYAATYNKFAADHSDQNVVAIAVAPVDNAKLVAAGYSADVTNEKIASFNDSLSGALSGSNIKFCANTYTDMIGIFGTYIGSDGLHYTIPTGNKKIYDIIMNNCGMSSGSGIVGDNPESVESESVACDSRTKDVGVFAGYHGGNMLKIRLCELSIPSSGGDDNGAWPDELGGTYSGGKARVNSRASGAFASMIEAAQSNGITVKALSSFRTMAHQQSLCNGNAACSSGSYGSVAKPGNSNHQMGLAIDFNIDGGASTSSCVTVGGICTPPGGTNAFYVWLRANSCTYKIYQYQAEYWHFDTLNNSTRVTTCS